MAELIILAILFFALAVAEAGPGAWILFFGFAVVAIRSYVDRRKKKELAERLSALDTRSDLLGV